MYLPINNEMLIKRLASKQGKIRMVLDTDTYNEVDDQFALVYALCSPEKIKVEAVYAAPFHNNRSADAGDGMEKSYSEIIRLLKVMGIPHENFVFKGSDKFMQEKNQSVDSDAARDLIKRAMESEDDDPLYVAAIAAITNVASAILMEPKIVNKIVVVWLGGQPLHWHNAMEFNLQGDIKASQIAFDSGVPLVQIPCMGVASHLLTSVPELERYLLGRNQICDTLVKLFKAYNSDHFGWAKEIWDISAIAYLINSGWVSSSLVHSPILTDNYTYSFDKRRHFIRVATQIDRNAIFKDMFRKITEYQD
ncbi:MAG: nucleoside hydrolase [Treponema sp.]|jgi:inosine-uridine nucleoside N-ribohydrolase|nr:nucleoside hydrolase [Treponema sp.]